MLVLAAAAAVLAAAVAATGTLGGLGVGSLGGGGGGDGDGDGRGRSAVEPVAGKAPSAAARLEFATKAAATLGIAPGGLNVDKAEEFEELLDRPLHAVTEFTSRKSWDDAVRFLRSQMRGNSHGRPGWDSFAPPDDFLFVASIPLVVGSESPRTATGERAAVRYQRQVAAGDHDEHFAAMAEVLVDGGHPDAVIRLAWEHSGNWFLHRGDLAPDVWIKAWRRAVEAMRSVPGARFSFEWPLANGSSTGADPATWYPGDDYVDVIGMSVYDTWWGSVAVQVEHQDPRQRTWAEPEAVWEEQVTRPYGMAWMADFAAARGKPIGIGEWGLAGGSTDEQGRRVAAGNDNPYFIRAMHDWLNEQELVYHSYFEKNSTDGLGPHGIASYPNAREVFVELFGKEATR